jgi:hypothetical protein
LRLDLNDVVHVVGPISQTEKARRSSANIAVLQLIVTSNHETELVEISKQVWQQRPNRSTGFFWLQDRIVVGNEPIVIGIFFNKNGNYEQSEIHQKFVGDSCLTDLYICFAYIKSGITGFVVYGEFRHTTKLYSSLFFIFCKATSASTVIIGLLLPVRITYPFPRN